MKNKSKHILFLTGILSFVSSFTSCLENDIPYARIQPNFTEISAKGQEAPASIDTTRRTVTFYLPEEVNISDVEIDSYRLAPDVTLVGDTLLRPLDLTTPKTVTLRLYQDWQWTLSARQNIERYFSVEGQIGQTNIDVPAHSVTAYVSENADLGHLLVNACKLGPKGSVMSPEIAGEYVDFTKPLEVDLTVYGQLQKWTITIGTIEAKVSTERVDAWTNVAWVYGQVEAGREVSVQYRMNGDDEWITAPDAWLTVDGGTFYSRLLHLQPNTAYEARAISGEDYGQTISFTTGGVRQLPNGDFDNWWLDGKVWNPWAQDGQKFWDTGNKGATTLGQSNSVPTTDTPTGTGHAAMLETRFVGIGGLGKLAAGNIFAGDYVRTVGTNGILSFGREFNLRPTGLKGYYRYVTAPISSASAGFEELRGQPDTCIIWVALIDAPEPCEIRTNPRDRKLFDPDAEDVIAYGKIEYSGTMDGYVPFEFNLDYRATDRVPRYILVTASASKYGDYFTGGNGAVLYLDDLQLIYDY